MNLKHSVLKDELILPKGFKAAGIHAGIKKEKKDLAFITSDVPAAMAGLFTTNQVHAAPVKLCKEKIKSHQGQAILINSGNANACTGAQGLSNAKQMAKVVADSLGIDETMVFVCSTGHIGEPMPMDVITRGIPKVFDQLSTQNGLQAAEAIMTTDTEQKYGSTQIHIDEHDVIISGIAKGSGMIHPNMATMLAFIMTDATVNREALQECLHQAVEKSFNRISVDGDTSTNDTVLFMANGLAENTELSPSHSQWADFTKSVDTMCYDLALKMVQDGEGATKTITVRVQGAQDHRDADLAARSVVHSIEVRASWHSDKVGWGRVMHALGYSKAKIVEEKVDVCYNGVQAVSQGMGTDTPKEKLKEAVNQNAFTIDINLNIADGEAVIYSCDCTEEYIRLNTY
ncbi:MAG: bifunctional glutamate N-acetyltransferase/amino-acid acetyltransferase ArgJ [Kiritimatiellae bacterium]|nr:bifunctional glutamate N-acetyltransferase/amino-acid acetyltransferase ArgJ [Kiritimatiellia bacterium]